MMTRMVRVANDCLTTGCAMLTEWIAEGNYRNDYPEDEVNSDSDYDHFGASSSDDVEYAVDAAQWSD